MRKIAKIAVASAVYSFDRPFDYYIPEEYVHTLAVGDRVLVPFGKGNTRTEGFVLDISEVTGDAPQLKNIAFHYDDGISLSQEDISLALWLRSKYFCTFFDAANVLLPPAMWHNTVQVFSLNMPFESALSVTARSKIKRRIVEFAASQKSEVTALQIEKNLESPRIKEHLKQLCKDGVLLSSHKFEGKTREKTRHMVRLALPAEEARGEVGTGKLSQKRLDVIECLCQRGEVSEKELCYLTGVTSSLIRRLGGLGIVELFSAEIESFPQLKALIPDEMASPLVLTDKQKRVFNDLCGLYKEGTASCALLHGVTGSGKTAVYIELIRKVIASGKSTIFLVPEIALTPQMVRQFCAHFGEQVAVIHSGLTYSQRYSEYKRIKSGQALVVIGARSAVFAPCGNIGAIIIDEEHENTYKSENSPRYHARDVAKYRCVKHNALLVLGSATPSVESYYNAATGRYSLFTLEERYNNLPLPQAVISDMKKTLTEGDDSVIGPELQEATAEALDKKEQTILFINRRGNARMAVCPDCGHIPQCRNCSAPLTYHSANGRLMCHHCGFSEALADSCPECGGSRIRLVGAGTQKIEEQLAELFPKARVLRMDADTTSGRDSHEKTLSAFERGEADILIGTQMVSKGLDFPNVTLVGVVDADLALYSSSFLAAERTFSLISQVAGRAGRRQTRGKVIIQTFAPENPVIKYAAEQDYLGFYQYEIKVRELTQSPPFFDIFTFTLSGANENEVLKAALRLSAGLSSAFANEFADIAAPVLGPVPPPIARLNRKYRFVLSFKGRESRRTGELVYAVPSWFRRQPEGKYITLFADVNSRNI